MKQTHDSLFKEELKQTHDSLFGKPEPLAPKKEPLDKRLDRRLALFGYGLLFGVLLCFLALIVRGLFWTVGIPWPLEKL